MLNVHAPEFVPGQQWPGIDVTSDESCQQPLIVYGNVDSLGRSMSNFVNARDMTTSPNQAMIDQGISASNLLRSKLQALIHRRRAEQVDNTNKARYARSVFDHCFGDDENNLQAWQDLCFFCGRDPARMPAGIPGCKRWLRYVYINIFDVTQAVMTNAIAEPRFDNASELEIYSRQSGNICPVAAAEGNPFFRFMLKKWF